MKLNYQRVCNNQDRRDDRATEKESLIGTTNTLKGGLRTLPFIIANETFEKVASYGILPNMIIYLMKNYGMELSTASNFIFYWSAATTLAPVIAAFLADSYLGRFWMIGFGSIFSLLGMILLWLTTIIPGATPCDDSSSKCTLPNFFQLTLLASSFGIMSIGAGGIRSSSLAFGTNQLLKQGNPHNTSIFERFLNWYFFVTSASVIVAMTFVVYIQDTFGWKVGFGVPVVLMLLSALFYFLASPLYIKLKAEAESPIAFVQVLTASLNKRHLIDFSDGTQDSFYYRRHGSKIIMPSDKLRYLNKACMISNVNEELTLDGKAINPWKLCTIDKVEEVKTLINVIPIWSTGIIFSLTSFLNPFQVLLTKSMDRHITSNFEIPTGSFATFRVISLVSWIAIYDLIVIPLATKIVGKPVKLSARNRMGIGLVLSCVSMAAMAIVEGVRRETAIQEGFLDDPNGVIDMSGLWLCFHYWISGMADAFFVIGANEFFCSEFPTSMLSLATNLYCLSTSLSSVFASLLLNAVDYITRKGGKESWVSSNINRAHFDYYYWVATALCFLNFLYYILCNKAYGPSAEEQGQHKFLLDYEEIVDE